jgi:hypothetical protein
MKITDLNSELLFEAKAKMRDTKGTRDKVVNWVLEQGEPFIDTMTKDAALMNGLVATLAKVAGKKMKGGKYSLTDADFRKIAQKNFTVHNLGKPTFKKITSFAGGGKPHTATKDEPKTTKKTSTKSIDKDTIIADIEKIIGGKKYGDQIEWEKDERVTEREAFRMAERQASGLSKYFDMNRVIDSDEGTDYNDPEWGGYDQNYKYEVYGPKKEYAGILRKLTIGGRETGDYSGDWADAYIRVFIN